MAKTFTLPLRRKHMATSANTSKHHDCALSEPAANTVPLDSAFGKILSSNFEKKKDAIDKQHRAALSELVKKHSTRLRDDLQIHYLGLPSFFARPRSELSLDLVKLHCTIVSKAVFTSDGQVRKLPIIPKELLARARRRFLRGVKHLRRDRDSAMSTLMEEYKMLFPEILSTGPE